MAASTPLEAKHLGTRAQKEAPRGLVAQWHSIKESVMMEAVEAKFGQNAELREALLATGNEMLVEASPRDGFWGALASEHSIQSTKMWTGLNHMGRILMVLRESFGRSSANTTPPHFCITVALSLMLLTRLHVVLSRN